MRPTTVPAKATTAATAMKATTNGRRFIRSAHSVNRESTWSLPPWTMARYYSSRHRQGRRAPRPPSGGRWIWTRELWLICDRTLWHYPSRRRHSHSRRCFQLAPISTSVREARYQSTVWVSPVEVCRCPVPAQRWRRGGSPAAAAARLEVVRNGGLPESTRSAWSQTHRRALNLTRRGRFWVTLLRLRPGPIDRETTRGE